MGRTGKMFAIEHWGLVPDIIAIAKGIASGMPLGAMVSQSEVMTWIPGLLLFVLQGYLEGWSWMADCWGASTGTGREACPTSCPNKEPTREPTSAVETTAAFLKRRPNQAKQCATRPLSKLFALLMVPAVPTTTKPHLGWGCRVHGSVKVPQRVSNFDSPRLYRQTVTEC